MSNLESKSKFYENNWDDFYIRLIFHPKSLFWKTRTVYPLPFNQGNFLLVIGKDLSAPLVVLKYGRAYITKYNLAFKKISKLKRMLRFRRTRRI